MLQFLNHAFKGRVFTHTHTYAHMHTRTHAHTRTHTHAHTHTHTHTHTHSHTHTNTHTHTHKHHTEIHTQRYTHMHMHTYTHARTLTHTYIHPSIQPYRQWYEAADFIKQELGRGGVQEEAWLKVRALEIKADMLRLKYIMHTYKHTHMCART